MSISVPIISIKNHNCGIINKNNAANTVAFKGKPIVLDDKGWVAKKINWLGDDFTSAMQRLVSGATALATQPFFDWNNKNVDEKTRKTSTARTLGKIIAGTATGVAIRELCVRATKNFTQNEHTEQYLIDKGKKTETNRIKTFTTKQQWLLPESFKEAPYRKIKAYRGAVGTFTAVLVMIGTNFLIDAPLTTYLANKFSKMFGVSDANKPDAQKNEGGKQ